MNPVDNGPAYEAILLGGKRSPGIVTLSGHDRDHEWDVRKPMSMGGAATLYRGENVTDFTATFSLIYEPGVSPNEFDAWTEFETVIKGMLPPGGKPRPLDIYHPDLESRGILTVRLVTLGGMVHDGKGGATIAVKFGEYRKPKPRVEDPAGPAKDAGAPDPNAALKAELAALLKQAEAP